MAGRVSDTLVDTSHTLEEDTELSIVTAKDDDGLEVLRHSCAHLMAQAVQQLFPSAQVTIGPVIEDGFFYDFAYERPFTPEDLEKIEKKMEELAKRDLKVERSVMSRPESVELFSKMGEGYKVQILESIPTDEDLSFYRQGDFIDLCRGPHVPSTGKIQAFKLTKVAGAYWRGDSNNEMLQRIYGTAWADKKSLRQYLHRLEEAEKRDHRKLGKKYDLFHTQEEAPGMVFWHPKGWQIWQIIEQYIREVQNANGYQEINTPQMVDMSLWEKSGHADKFGDDMFSVNTDNRLYAIKPMNCPCHVQVFNQGLKSYRDLPLRLVPCDLAAHRLEFRGREGRVQDHGTQVIKDRLDLADAKSVNVVPDFDRFKLRLELRPCIFETEGLRWAGFHEIFAVSAATNELRELVHHVAAEGSREEFPSGHQHAMYLSQSLGPVGNVIEHMVGEYAIEVTRCQRNLLGIDDLEINGEITRSKRVSGALDHTRRKIAEGEPPAGWHSFEILYP